MKLIWAILITVLSAWSTAASANSDGSADIGVSATVPLVCEVDSYSVVLDSTHERATGFIQEMCNGGNGFRMMATYRALDGGEQVQVDYGGQVSELGSSGLTQIAYRAGASFRTVPVTIETHGLSSSFAVSIGITAV